MTKARPRLEQLAIRVRKAPNWWDIVWWHIELHARGAFGPHWLRETLYRVWRQKMIKRWLAKV